MTSLNPKEIFPAILKHKIYKNKKHFGSKETLLKVIQEAPKDILTAKVSKGTILIKLIQKKEWLVLKNVLLFLRFLKFNWVFEPLDSLFQNPNFILMHIQLLFANDKFCVNICKPGARYRPVA